MQLYPTIHIKNGRCYHPNSAEINPDNPYTYSPVRLAKEWEMAGASYLHIVDMDGIIMGMSVNDDLISQITSSVAIPVQVGGGIRSIKDIDNMLNRGVARVVCGTKVISDPRFPKEAIDTFGSDKFVVGIDAINGMIAIEGREKLSEYNCVSFAKDLEEYGVRTVIYTDVTSSFHQSGPSIDNARELIARSGLDIIYAGGIRNLSDVESVASLDVKGVVIGRALYNGKINLEEAITIFEKGL